jgi:hypothetical protein
MPITDNMSRGRDSIDDMEMDAGSDISDDGRNSQDIHYSSHMKNIRNAKSKKKADLAFKLGMRFKESLLYRVYVGQNLTYP